jgi:biopolymer transport exbB protein
MNKIYALFLAVFICGCVGLPKKAPQSDVYTSSVSESKNANVKKKIAQSEVSGRLNENGLRLLDLMQDYLGKKDGGDCSGFVSLINKKFRDSFFNEKELHKFYTARGLKSEAMFRLYESKNLISFENPEVGDLIFFNNTTKNTKNNKKAKIITHVGIVSSVEKDGTVGFTHNTRGKNAVHFMNLNEKDTHKKGKKELNSYVVACKSKSAACLAANRFAGYGKARIND